MTDLCENNYDVVIVGAGPAGSSTAIRLAGNGLRVLLVEQKRFPREKLCGEFISPECLAHFAELDVLSEMTLAGGTSLNRTVFYARNGKSVAVPSEWFGTGSHALGLSRAEMDARLLIRAVSAGADVRQGTQATGLLIENERVCGVQLRDSNRTTFGVTADLTIDATGRGRILARQVKNEHGSRTRKRARFVAFKTHLQGAAIPDGDCEIYAYRGGYGGCSRIENDRYNLCFIVSANAAKKCGGNAAKIMRSVVLANKRAARSLKNARIVEDWLAVPIESYGRSELAPAEGLLTVGDAAAFIDPFTGSGILLSLESSKIVAGIISREFSKPGAERSFTGLAREYHSQYAAAFDRRLRVGAVLRHAAFAPLLTETVIKILALSSRLTRHLAKATRPKTNERKQAAYESN